MAIATLVALAVADAIETVYGLGLDDYYQMRQDAAQKPDDQRQAFR